MIELDSESFYPFVVPCMGYFCRVHAVPWLGLADTPPQVQHAFTAESPTQSVMIIRQTLLTR